MTSITHLETHLKGYITSITNLEGMQTHLKGIHDLNYSSRDSSKGVHYLNNTHLEGMQTHLKGVHDLNY